MKLWIVSMKFILPIFIFAAFACTSPEVSHVNRGVELRKNGMLEEAIIEYDSAIRENPEFALAFNNRGRAYFDLQEYEKAIGDFDESIRLNPQDSLAYANRGMTYRSMRQHRQAQFWVPPPSGHVRTSQPTLEQL